MFDDNIRDQIQERDEVRQQQEQWDRDREKERRENAIRENRITHGGADCGTIGCIASLFVIIPTIIFLFVHVIAPLTLGYIRQPTQSTPSIQSIPQLASSYRGTGHNITVNLTSSVALNSIKEDQQGNISGNVVWAAPLYGSGPFTGTVSSDHSINFTSTPTDGSGFTIIYTGTISAQNTISGSYSANGQTGTWQVIATPTTQSVPQLASSYRGTGHNITHNSTGSLTLSSITEDQQGNIRGQATWGYPLCGSGPFTGIVSASDSIQFTVTTADGSNCEPITTFTGTINEQINSMSGTYGTTDQTGSWQVVATSS